MATATSVIAGITVQTAMYTPSVIAGIQVAEAASMADPTITGTQKAAAVIAGVSQSLEGSPNVNVASIAALVNLSVNIATALGLFSHKAKA